MSSYLLVEVRSTQGLMWWLLEVSTCEIGRRHPVPLLVCMLTDSLHFGSCDRALDF